MRHDYRMGKRLLGALAAVALLAGTAAAVLVLAVGAGAHTSGPQATGGGTQTAGHSQGTGARQKTSASQTTAIACGKAAPETLAQTVGWVARRIYIGEVHSSETIKDRLQVETYLPLLHAMANGDRAAIKTAVTSLVYAHTHIV